MSERARNIATTLFLAVTAALVITLVATTPSEADRVETIGQQIKCPTCQGESISNSPSDIAQDMMALVEERVAGGSTDEAIIDELLASYSGAVLLNPPASGNTLVLWLAPLAALAVGIGVILWWRKHPGTQAEPAPTQTRSKKRTLVGAGLLIGAAAVTVIVAGFFLQDRGGPSSGVAEQQIDNLDDVSNETMEAVVAANIDNPQVNGMRLALAERYYEINDYRSAFPHYLSVVESSTAVEGEVVTALVRLGWMAWDGNGEANAAIGLLDQALSIDPSASTAAYLKAQVLWCGGGDIDQASDLLEDVLSTADLATDARQIVETDLDAILSGESCE